MPRAILLAALLLAAAALPAPAAAQWPCWPSQVAVSDGGATLPVPGRGTPLRFAEDAAARAYGWLCPSEYEPPRMVLVSGPLSAWAPDWQQIGLALLTATPAERAAAVAKYATARYPVVNGSLQVPADVYPVHRAVWDRLQLDRPPDPVWRVAPNAGYSTRSAFAYSGGIRATVATARATVDALCYCDTREMAAGGVYCAVNAARTWMSLCTRRQ